MMELPPGYSVSKSPNAPSRWMVAYRNDPYLFEKRINAAGETRITTFKTKSAAIQAAIEHKALIDKLEAQSLAAQKVKE